MSGDAGNDSLSGGNDNDDLYGGDGADSLDGGSGADSLSGGAGGDVLVGGTEDDGLDGGAGNDVLTGGSGADSLVGGSGADDMSGGIGDDNYVVDAPGDRVFELAGGGSDTINTTVSFSLAAGQEIERLAASNPASIVGIRLIGNEFANHLAATSGADFLAGGGGADVLTGRGGNDIYDLGNGTDTIDETSGIDTIISTISRNLAAYASIERLTLAGTASISGTGNGINNVIIGNLAANILLGEGGNDVLSGLGGNDRLFGGVGNDTLTGGLNNDAFVFNTPPNALNRDTITDFVPADDTIQLENAVFTRLVANGTLVSGNFFAGPAAHDANDYIVYNQATGALFYDANGNGAGGAVQFATISNRPTLTNADFLVI
jgi:Ca2+-binding RTX toxin-like protein